MADHKLRSRQSLLCRFQIPLKGFDEIFENARAIVVAATKFVLGICMPLLGSLMKPLHRFGVVLWHTLSEVVFFSCLKPVF